MWGFTAFQITFIIILSTLNYSSLSTNESKRKDQTDVDSSCLNTNGLPPQLRSTGSRCAFLNCCPRHNSLITWYTRLVSLRLLKRTKITTKAPCVPKANNFFEQTDKREGKGPQAHLFRFIIIHVSWNSNVLNDLRVVRCTEPGSLKTLQLPCLHYFETAHERGSRPT